MCIVLGALLVSLLASRFYKFGIWWKVKTARITFTFTNINYIITAISVHFELEPRNASTETGSNDDGRMSKSKKGTKIDWKKLSRTRRDTMKRKRNDEQRCARYAQMLQSWNNHLMREWEWIMQTEPNVCGFSSRSVCVWMFEYVMWSQHRPKHVSVRVKIF